MNDEKTTSDDSWKAPHERGEFAVREERAPWGRWILGLIVLGLVIAGALWLASKVVVPRDLPVKEQAQTEPEKEAPKIMRLGSKRSKKIRSKGIVNILRPFPRANMLMMLKLKLTLMTIRHGRVQNSAI